MECLFCKIARGEIKSEKIYEDDNSIAFLDVNPCAPGHTVVVPKQHFSSILDMDDELLCSVFKAVKKVTKMIKDGLKPDGFTIGINQGEAAGGRIPHLNIHIIPRFVGDKGAMIQMIVRNQPTEDLSTIAGKIKSTEELPDYIKKQIKQKESLEDKREENFDDEIGVSMDSPMEKMALHLEPEMEKKELSEEKLEKYEKEEIKEKEKKYKGKEQKDKEEEELEEMERILRRMQIPR